MRIIEFFKNFLSPIVYGDSPTLYQQLAEKVDRYFDMGGPRHYLNNINTQIIRTTSEDLRHLKIFYHAVATVNIIACFIKKYRFHQLQVVWASVHAILFVAKAIVFYQRDFPVKTGEDSIKHSKLLVDSPKKSFKDIQDVEKAALDNFRGKGKWWDSLPLVEFSETYVIMMKTMKPYSVAKSQRNVRGKKEWVIILKIQNTSNAELGLVTLYRQNLKWIEEAMFIEQNKHTPLISSEPIKVFLPKPTDITTRILRGFLDGDVINDWKLCDETTS